MLAAGPLTAASDHAALSAARAQYEAGRLDEAEHAFEKLAASEARNAEASFYRGEIALLRNNPDKAVKFFEQAVNAAPDVSPYHHRLGDAYGRAAQEASIFRALGLARKCLAAFKRAVELDPGNLDARYSLFTFYLGAPRIIGGGTGRAAAEAAAIKERDADRARVAFAALHVQQKQFDRARAELAEMRALDLASVRSDRVFLSDVQWTSAEVGWGEPARNHTWFDEKNPRGVVLLVHGRLYGKGLFAHSPSRYSFNLEGKWNIFSATVGLRDGAPEEGAAIFTVRGDGRELFRSAQLRVNASQRVRLEVSGIHELELLTEPGSQDNASSWAIWAEPRLRR